MVCCAYLRSFVARENDIWVLTNCCLDDWIMDNNMCVYILLCCAVSTVIYIISGL